MTKKKSDALYTQECLWEYGETVIITTKRGRNDHNGGHVQAVTNRGCRLGSASGGGYDLHCAAMWEAVCNATGVHYDDVIASRYGYIYANYDERWTGYFSNFGLSVRPFRLYDSAGRTEGYMVIIEKIKGV